MSDEFTVEHEDAPGYGRYVIALADGLEAEMTYRKLGENVIVIDHTYTPPQMRGRNVAALLMNAAIAGARSNGHKIVPQCSYAAAQFRRHPEWADLLAQ
jgi:predicted GNAT family acetyltransferase